MLRSFSDILDECLDRVLLRGELVEACIGDYPEHAAELQEALSTAVRFNTVADFSPDPERNRQARLRFFDALDRKRAAMPWWRPRWLGTTSGRLLRFGISTRLAVTTVAVMLVVLGGSGGSALAAQNSVPGDVLYPVKQVGERAQIMFAISDSRKANFHAELLERRVEELDTVTKKGRVRFVPRLAKESQRHSERARVLTEAPVKRVVTVVDVAPSSISRPDGAAAEQTPGQVATVTVRLDRLLELHERLILAEEQIKKFSGNVDNIETKRELDLLFHSVQYQREKMQTALVLFDTVRHAHNTAISAPTSAPRQDVATGTPEALAPIGTPSRDQPLRPTATSPSELIEVRVVVISVNITRLVIDRTPRMRLDLLLELPNGERHKVQVIEGKARLIGKLSDLHPGAKVGMAFERGMNTVRVVKVFQPEPSGDSYEDEGDGVRSSVPSRQAP